MLNDKQMADPSTLQVLDYADPLVRDGMARGEVNTPEDVILENVRRAIRRGHPQIHPCPAKPERVCLVGSGPTLNETRAELRELYFAGAHVVTVNGAYHWCLAQNLRPSTQIVLDARASNARFVDPPVPRCRYVLASQCDKAVWDAVEGREHVWIFHAAGGDGPIKDLLDAYYLGRWFGIGGGVTVGTRALMLLANLGYLRIDLFGMDSCWLDAPYSDDGPRVVHHAFDQPENSRDRVFEFTLSLPDPDVPPRVFRCSPWHLKQFEDFLQLLQINRDHFVLHVHGRGLLAAALEMLGPSGDVGTLEQRVVDVTPL